MSSTTKPTKPTLPQLVTPLTSTFPSELSALPSSALPSARSPHASFADLIKREEDSLKTPITPPTAYTDFLKTIHSPVIGDKFSGRSTPTSAPSTASSAPSTSSSLHSNCSCAKEKEGSASASASPPLPQSAKLPNTSASTSTSQLVVPSSAPASGSRLAKLRIPASPACSGSGSPMSASCTSSAVRSPFSARSPYEWDLSYKGGRRYFDVKSACSSPKSARAGVKHVREIVTRTVTYTPRMSPAPKGKRRKIEQE